MTAPTREKVVLWACESGDWNRQTCEMNDAGLVIFATLARADLEATIAEQAAEIADYELANSNIHQWRNKYRASISSEIEKANSLSRQLTAEQAKVAELEAIEANLCDLHNVALEQVAVEQAKVKLLTEALDKAATHVRPTCDGLYRDLMKALVAVKEGK